MATGVEVRLLQRIVDRCYPGCDLGWFRSSLYLALCFELGDDQVCSSLDVVVVHRPLAVPY